MHLSHPPHRQEAQHHSYRLRPKNERRLVAGFTAVSGVLSSSEPSLVCPFAPPFMLLATDFVVYDSESASDSVDRDLE